jgi:hypothetical protein
MNFQWARSTKLLAVLLAIAVVIVGVLTALVMRQQHDLSTVKGQVHLGTAPGAPGASAPAGADIVANPNVVTRPEPAATPDRANAPVGPSQPAPVSPAPPVDPAPRVVPAPPAAPAPGPAITHVNPALVAPAPHATTPHRTSPPRQKPVLPNAPPPRPADPLPAPRQPEPALPVPPAPPQTDPDQPTNSDVSGKPGKPDDSWKTGRSQASDRGPDADQPARQNAHAKPKNPAAKPKTPAATPTDPDTSDSTDTSERPPASTKPKAVHHKAPTAKVDNTLVPYPPKPVRMSPVAPDSGDFSASNPEARKQENVQLPDQ